MRANNDIKCIAGVKKKKHVEKMSLKQVRAGIFRIYTLLRFNKRISC